MKIVQAAGWYFPDSVGGTEVYVASLARQLAACGHEVRIAAPEQGGRDSRSYTHDGVEVFRYPIAADLTRDEAQGRQPTRGTSVFHEWLAAVRPDVVHAHTFVSGLALPELAAARRAGARVVATTHSSSLGFLCQRGTLMWRGETLCDGRVERVRCAACELQHRGGGTLMSEVFARVPRAIASVVGGVPGRIGTGFGMGDLIEHNLRRQREMFDLVDAFVLLTQRAADIVVDNGGPAHKVAVNRLGISHDGKPRKRARRAGAVVRVGYVGRFDPVKGVNDLGDAVRRLPEGTPIEVEFRGPAATSIDHVTRSALESIFEGDGRVRFGDAVAPAAIPELMAGYDVLCCPSRCLEGGPTVGLEAMAVGTPVIAAAAGGLAEVIEDGVNGRLVRPGDVSGLAAALEAVANDPEQTIDRWRTRLPRPRTMRDVAADYLALYGARA